MKTDHSKAGGWRLTRIGAVKSSKNMIDVDWTVIGETIGRRRRVLRYFMRLSTWEYASGKDPAVLV